jgi:hypothetical protein
MTILFTGTESEAFNFSSPPVVSTTATFFDNRFVRHALRLPTSEMSSAKWAPGEKNVWLHFDGAVTNTTGFAGTIGLKADDGTQLVFLNGTSNQDWWLPQFYIRTPAGTSQYVYRVADTFLNRRVVDIHYRNTVDGRIALYIDFVKVYEITGDFSALPDARYFSAGSTANFPAFYISQVIVATTTTLGHKLAYQPPLDNGIHTAWTGDVSQVNQTLVNDASFISSNTPDQRESFTKALFTVPIGMTVRAVGVSSRARSDESGPQKLSHMLRFGSTDYDSPATDLDVGLTTVQHLWHLNPATGEPWVNIDAGSATLEFGVKAVA